MVAPSAPRVAADRVAKRRSGANQVLVLQSAPAHAAAAPRAGCQGALVDRAGLPGAQARTRPRPLRGPQLARVSSSCQPVHRSLRLSDRRALPFSPSTAFHPQADRNTCATRRLPAAGGRRCGLSGMCRVQSQASAVSLPSDWSKRCPDVPAVCGNSGADESENDTVRVSAASLSCPCVKVAKSPGNLLVVPGMGRGLPPLTSAILQARVHPTNTSAVCKAIKSWLLLNWG